MPATRQPTLGRITHSRESLQGDAFEYWYDYEPAGFLRNVRMKFPDGEVLDPAFSYAWDVNGNRDQILLRNA